MHKCIVECDNPNCRKQELSSARLFGAYARPVGWLHRTTSGGEQDFCSAECACKAITPPRLRDFKVVADWARRAPGVTVKLPARSTQDAAGYDIFSLEEKTVLPGEKEEFAIDIKVYMQRDEVFKLYPRSNQGITFDLMLANTTGVIDADYYENPENDGVFTIVLRNLGTEPYEVKMYDKIAQGVFQKYLLADGDNPEDLPKRNGGIGSTGR